MATTQNTNMMLDVLRSHRVPYESTTKTLEYLASATQLDITEVTSLWRRYRKQHTAQLTAHREKLWKEDGRDKDSPWADTKTHQTSFCHTIDVAANLLREQHAQPRAPDDGAHFKTVVSNLKRTSHTFEKHGYAFHDVSWEDCDRKKNSAIGDNISDWTLETRYGICPMIRPRNFTDRTLTIRAKEIGRAHV